MKPLFGISGLHRTSLGEPSGASVAIISPARGLLARGRFRSRWVDFYELTKPRMNFLVLVTTMVGYCVAARGAMDVRGWMLMLDTLVGTALTAAGASALNQYLEREYDGRMRRTAGRPLPAGRVAPQDARLFGMLLGISGVLYLALFVNLLTAALGAFTLGTYVLITHARPLLHPHGNASA